MNMFRTFGLLAAATFALALPAQAYWDAWQADDLHGHNAVTVVDTIETAEGVQVERLEEWGELIVATVVEQDGSVQFRYFDPRKNLTRVNMTAR